MSELNLKEVLDFCIDLARKAGAEINAGSEKRLKEGTAIDIKLNTADLVTETDQAVEKLVMEAIKAKYPSHKFIGEESYSAGEKAELTDEPTWIVDPIDGTTNFTRANFPFTCISIGFVYKTQPVIGVVYAPRLDHLYYGLSGQGSFLVSPQFKEPRRLPLTKPLPLPSLRQALMALEWGSLRDRATMEKKLGFFERLVGDGDDGVKGGQMLQGVRSLGSAALNFSQVGAGTLDAYHEIGVWSWDVCAGIVIAREAGAVVIGAKSELSKINEPEFFGSISPEVLQGRKYLVVRSIADTPEEKGRAAQIRTIKAIYGALDEWEP
ncbi:unnamed protein product [Tilletia controversa]|uniref:Inositol-1-monophosphatase n=3 Tax=Tilletia TaxID=13289 RepID=A0A8X7MZA4_9BASI|nr:hypothetical protein CF336_g878 [Tilletia laevis]KAE8203928.1 hypothetical protein CF328_g1377 [Tilletia controversa]KAE8264482.1 hypothetical protein A4X03_0g909 [Tilletia caries]KAE8207729.1 hypothetical protein CF335_g937 [Tilletia laevis]KAE8253102.1 hypothetical protein A4X06_0g1698 [Tilletia controversa]